MQNVVKVSVRAASDFVRTFFGSVFAGLIRGRGRKLVTVRVLAARDFARS